MCKNKLNIEFVKVSTWVYTCLHLVDTLNSMISTLTVKSVHFCVNPPYKYNRGTLNIYIYLIINTLVYFSIILFLYFFLFLQGVYTFLYTFCQNRYYHWAKSVNLVSTCVKGVYTLYNLHVKKQTIWKATTN